nr:MAG TPA: hypothetical protein [Caudoviricetes sp.]
MPKRYTKIAKNRVSFWQEWGVFGGIRCIVLASQIVSFWQELRFFEKKWRLSCQNDTKIA